MIFEKVKAILVKELSLSEEEVTMTSSFEELGIDSLDLVELVMQIEEEFDITMEDAKQRKGQKYIGKPNFARALVAKGYVSSVKEAFAPDKFLNAPEIKAMIHPHINLPLNSFFHIMCGIYAFMQKRISSKEYPFYLCSPIIFSIQIILYQRPNL